MIQDYKSLIVQINSQQSTLDELDQHCAILKKQPEVNAIALQLSEQLVTIRRTWQQQITVITTHISVLEIRLKRLRDQPESIQSVTQADDTLASIEMPSHEAVDEPEKESVDELSDVTPLVAVVTTVQHIETQTSKSEERSKPHPSVDEEQQTSFPLDTAPATVVDTNDHSMQTVKERKPTENITVTQTYTQDGHETIQFESGPNPTVSDIAQDVFVDATYHQVPVGQTHRSSELLLRNVPQTFETTFVEPNETTTEVIVEADGTKRIIVRKLTQSVQHVTQHQQHQQFTTVSTLVGDDLVPISESVSQINVANQRTTDTTFGETGSRTVVVSQEKGSFQVGTEPQMTVVHQYETAPLVQEFETTNATLPDTVTEHVQIDPSQFILPQTQEGIHHEESSSIQTVVQHVTRKVIQRRRRIIKRVVIIDGIEHVTEEIIDEPDEIEITEEEAPQVQVNIVQVVNGKTVIAQERITETTPEAEEHTYTVSEPAPVPSQVFEHIIAAPVESITSTTKSTSTTNTITLPSAPETVIHVLDNSAAQSEGIVVQSLTLDEVNTIAQIIQPDEIVEEATAITHIDNIWPLQHHLEDLGMELSSKRDELPGSPAFKTPTPDRPVSDELWPTSMDTGADFVLEKYSFEAKSPTEKAIENVVDVIESENEKLVEDVKSIGDAQETKTTTDSITDRENLDSIVKTTTSSPDSKDAVIVEETLNVEEPESIHHVIESTEDDRQFDITPNEVNGKHQTIEVILKSNDQIKDSQISDVDIESRDLATSTIEEAYAPQIEESPAIDIIVKSTTPTESYDEPEPKKPVPAPRLQESSPQNKTTQNLDVRSVTQLFLDHEALSADPTTQTIKVSLPSSGNQSPGTVTVTMTKTGDEQTPNKINVNITEKQVIVVEPEVVAQLLTDYADTSKSEDSKRNRKKKKRKDKNPTPVVGEPEEINIVAEVPAVAAPEPIEVISPDGDGVATPTSEEVLSLDPSVVDSVELNVEDDNTLSDLPDIVPDVVEPVEEPVQREHEAIISPDESCITLAPEELDVSVKIVEESVIPCASTSPPPLHTEIIVTKSVLEEVHTEDIQQQTSPTNVTDSEITPSQSLNISIDIRSTQTSPEERKEVQEISMQTTPEPIVEQTTAEAQTLLTEVAEMESQTTPKSVTPEIVENAHLEQQPIKSSSEIEVQTDDVNIVEATMTVITTENSNQTIVVDTREQSLQTSPLPSPVQSVTQQADINIEEDVRPVAEQIVEDILAKIPFTVETSTEATNTESVRIVESETQTSQAPTPLAIDTDDLSISSSTTTTDEPYEIRIEATFNVNTDAAQSASQPTIIEVQKSFTIDEGGVCQEDVANEDKDSKKKKRKRNKKKKVDGNDTNEFLQHERNVEYANSKPEIGEVKSVKDVPKEETPMEIETDDVVLPVDQTSATEVKIADDNQEEALPRQEILTKKEVTNTEPEVTPIIETTTPSPRRVELTITTKQHSYELPIATEQVQSSPSPATYVDETDLIVSTHNEPTDLAHDILPIEQPEPTKPRLGKLTLTKTTISDIKHHKTHPTTSVTIEEALSPTEELDVPLTPGMDSADQYERAPESIWSATHQLLQNHAIQPSITSFEQTQPRKAEQQWAATSELISDRVRNIGTLRSNHLSNVLHLATLSENITEEPIENRIEALRNNVDTLAEALEQRDATVTQTTVISIIETVSTWLETIEYRVYLIRQQSSDGPSEEKVKAFNDLSSELQHIAANVQQVSKQIKQSQEFVTAEDKKHMTNCFHTLQSQVKAVEEITKENEDEAQKDLTRLNEFITQVEQVIVYMHILQERFTTIINEDISIEEKLFMLDELELANKEHSRDISKLLGAARTLSRDFPDQKVPQDIYGTHEVAKNLENNIYLERSRLVELQSLAEEYEQTLHEFEQITVLADSIVDKPIAADTLEELQQEMQKHRKFFVNLSHCRAILKSLEVNLDTETREKHTELRERLHERASNLLDRAAERAQRLSLAASRWTVLEKGMRDERQWLQVAQQRVPDLSAVTSADYDRYMTMYQSLSTDISVHYAKQVHLTNQATLLQELCKAPKLEDENNESLAVLLRLREEVSRYLLRLQSFSETWTVYDTLTDRLELWIKDAEQDIAQIQLPRDLRTQPIENMRQFWEVKVHYEVHNNIRTTVSHKLEQALQILPLADETLQRQFHAQLEERWKSLTEKINSIQSSIVNSIAAQDMSIDDKLTMLERELKEVQLNITQAKGVIKNEDELNLYIERMQVLKSRISIINNELGRIGMLPSTEPELIGDLFGLSHRISTQIADELEGASILKDRLIAIQLGIDHIRHHQQDNAATLDACESHEKMGSEHVEQALLDCQSVANELIGQWQLIMELRQLLHTLPMRLRVAVSPVKLERDISLLQDDHALLESRCSNIMGSLRGRLALWRRFEQQLEMVQQSVHETDYMMELLKVNGTIDYERLLKATERLEVGVF